MRSRSQFSRAHVLLHGPILLFTGIVAQFVVLDVVVFGVIQEENDVGMVNLCSDNLRPCKPIRKQAGPPMRPGCFHCILTNQGVHVRRQSRTVAVTMRFAHASAGRLNRKSPTGQVEEQKSYLREQVAPELEFIREEGSTRWRALRPPCPRLIDEVNNRSEFGRHARPSERFKLRF
jgi:hypothetical protein